VNNYLFWRLLNENAIRIQRAWRGFMGRRRFRIILEVIIYSRAFKFKLIIFIADHYLSLKQRKELNNCSSISIIQKQH
jgi:hypothetical protein